MEKIEIKRTPAGVELNIPHMVHHSPSGVEIGYAGSGPADCALSIMAHFLPGEDVKLWSGQMVSQKAWDLHQDFKFQVVSRMQTKLGGHLTLKSVWIEHWIKNQEKKAPHENSANP